MKGPRMLKKMFAACSGVALCTAALLVSYSAPAGAVANNGKVMVIIIENHSLQQMQAGMPYLNQKSNEYTYFDDYRAIEHPSEPNYLDIAFGDNMGSTSDHNPAYQTTGQSVFGQAIAATFSGSPSHGTAGTYAEDMTSNCKQSNGTVQVAGADAYAVKHNPWASASDERSLCNFADVPMGTTSSGNLYNNIVNGTLPNVGMMIPNQCNDAHQSSCGLATADNWLSQWIPLLMLGPDYQAGKLAIVVTADEDNDSSDDATDHNRVLTTVIHPNTAGDGVNHTTLNHYSLSGFLSDATGSPHLRNAATAPNMRAALGFPAPK